MFFRLQKKRIFLVQSSFHNKTIERFLLVYDLFDYKKKLPFEVLQNAVCEKPAKLEELTLLKVRLWLVLEYFRNGNFREFWYWAWGNFPVSGREFPVALMPLLR